MNKFFIEKKKQNRKRNSWMKNYLSDFFVKQTKIEKLRSKSSFKISEINNKFNLFKKGMNVIDIGSSPGGWSQYISKIIGKNGKIFACDILPMNYINNVFFIKGDISKEYINKKFLSLIGKNKINVVVSDILPNISGFSSIDLPKSIFLCEISLDICLKTILNSGYFLIKLIQGYDVNIFLNKIKYLFKKVKIIKPNSSRKNSREFYVLANEKNNFIN